MVWSFSKNPLKYLKVSEFISRDILNKNFLASIYFKFGSLYRSYIQKESSEQWLHICKPLLNGGDIWIWGLRKEDQNFLNIYDKI